MLHGADRQAIRRVLRPIKLIAGLVLCLALCFYGAVGSALRSWGGAPLADGIYARRLVNDCENVQQLDPEASKVCNMEVSTLTAAWNFVILFYMFFALMIVCDEFFVPALDVISNKLNLSPDVAGATLMAAGGSAPELFTSFVGALSPVPSDVGIVAIVGSAVFNVLGVIGACGIAAPPSKSELTDLKLYGLQLHGYPLARDSAFYLLHLSLLFFFFWDARVKWWEALILFLNYFLYCLFMKNSQKFEDKIDIRQEFQQLDTDGDGHISRQEAEANTELKKKFNDIDTDRTGQIDFTEFKRWKKVVLRARRNRAADPTQEAPDHSEVNFCPEDSSEASWKDWLYYIFAFPILVVLKLTVPDCRREGCCSRLYVLTFVLSIAWIAIFAFVMVHASEAIGAWTKIDSRILALTFLAVGTSVPDLLTSVLVTLQGHGDMAVSSSIGSNIFDVTVGLPLPWLTYCALNPGKDVEVRSKPFTLIFSIGSLCAMVLFTIGSIMWNGWVLNKTLGVVMIILYIAFIATSIFVVMNE